MGFIGDLDLLGKFFLKIVIKLFTATANVVHNIMKCFYSTGVVINVCSDVHLVLFEPMIKGLDIWRVWRVV